MDTQKPAAKFEIELVEGPDMPMPEQDSDGVIDLGELPEALERQLNRRRLKQEADLRDAGMKYQTQQMHEKFIEMLYGVEIASFLIFLELFDWPVQEMEHTKKMIYKFLSQMDYWRDQDSIYKAMAKVLEIKIELMELEKVENEKGARAAFLFAVSDRLMVAAGKRKAELTGKIYKDYYQALPDNLRDVERNVMPARMEVAELIKVIMQTYLQD